MQTISLQVASLGFFVVSGLLFVVLILLKGRGEDHSERFWLAGVILLFVLCVCPFMFGYLNWYAKDGYREFLFYVPFQQLLLIGPVFYGYILKTLNQGQTLPKKFWFHFIPASVYLLYSLIAFIGDAIVFTEPYFYADGRDKDLLPWYQIVGLCSMIAYVALSFRRYQIYSVRIVNELSFADAIALKWIKLFIVGLCFILFVRLVFLVLFPDFGNFGVKYWYYLTFSMLAYFLAIQGYSHLVSTVSIRRQNIFVLPESENINEHQKEPEKPPQNPSGQSVDKDLEVKKEKIRVLFEDDKLFEKPDLSLQNVAELLNWHLKETSVVINKGFGQNFNDFVNGFRVEAFKLRYTSKRKNASVLTTALECGFNSKSTFNRVFKRMTNQTPNEYIKSVKK